MKIQLLDIQTSDDCWVEKLGEDNEDGLQFSFDLNDINFQREKAAYRIRY